MPKKKFDERPYDPISADLVREATAVHAHQTRSGPSIALVSPRPLPSAIQPEPEPTITKRFVLTRSEDADVEAFLLRLQRAARTKVPLGVLMRAALALLMESEAKLCAAVEKETFRMPSTHDRVGLGEFEEQWRRCLPAAFQR